MTVIIIITCIWIKMMTVINLSDIYMTMVAELENQCLNILNSVNSGNDLADMDLSLIHI